MGIFSQITSGVTKGRQRAKKQNPVITANTYDRLAGKSHLSTHGIRQRDKRNYSNREKIESIFGGKSYNQEVFKRGPMSTGGLERFAPFTSKKQILDSFQRARNLPKTSGRGPQPRMGSKSGGEAGFSNTAQRIRMRDRKAKANTDRFGAI